MFRLIPKDEKYFDLFNQMGTYITDASKLLSQAFTDTRHSSMYAEKIRNLEHQCDELSHSIIAKLNHSFITPIDREDIYGLASSLDDVMDLIETISAHIVLFRIEHATEWSRHMVGLLHKISLELIVAIKKVAAGDSASTNFIEIQRLENEGDILYRQAIGDLFNGTQDTLHILKWKDLYDLLSRTIDKAEDAGDVLETIVLKHS